MTSPAAIDVNSETTIVGSPNKMLFLAFGAIAMAGLSFATAWPLMPDVVPGSLAQTMGWVGTVFFLFCAIFLVSRAFGKSRPSLVLSPQGFHYNGVSSEMIPWHAVTGVQALSYKRTRMIIVGVTEDIWRSPGLNRITRWSRNANRSLRIDGLPIPATGMPYSFDELMAIFLTYERHWAGR